MRQCTLCKSIGDGELSIHNSPERDMKLKEKWVQTLGLNESYLSQKFCICSRHFKKCDYLSATRLKRSAVPSVLLQVAAEAPKGFVKQKPGIIDHDYCAIASVASSAPTLPRLQPLPPGLRLPARPVFCKTTEPIFKKSKQGSVNENGPPPTSASAQAQSTVYVLPILIPTPTAPLQCSNATQATSNSGSKKGKRKASPISLNVNHIADFDSDVIEVSETNEPLSKLRKKVKQQKKKGSLVVSKKSTKPRKKKDSKAASPLRKKAQRVKLLNTARELAISRKCRKAAGKKRNTRTVAKSKKSSIAVTPPLIVVSDDDSDNATVVKNISRDVELSSEETIALRSGDQTSNTRSPNVEKISPNPITASGRSSSLANVAETPALVVTSNDNEMYVVDETPSSSGSMDSVLAQSPSAVNPSNLRKKTEQLMTRSRKRILGKRMIGLGKEINTASTSETNVRNSSTVPTNAAESTAEIRPACSASNQVTVSVSLTLDTISTVALDSSKVKELPIILIDEDDDTSEVELAASGNKDSGSRELRPLTVESSQSPASGRGTQLKKKGSPALLHQRGESCVKKTGESSTPEKNNDDSTSKTAKRAPVTENRPSPPSANPITVSPSPGSLSTANAGPVDAVDAPANRPETPPLITIIDENDESVFEKTSNDVDSGSIQTFSSSRPSHLRNKTVRPAYSHLPAILRNPGAVLNTTINGRTRIVTGNEQAAMSRSVSVQGTPAQPMNSNPMTAPVYIALPPPIIVHKIVTPAPLTGIKRPRKRRKDDVSFVVDDSLLGGTRCAGTLLGNTTTSASTLKESTVANSTLLANTTSASTFLGNPISASTSSAASSTDRAIELINNQRRAAAALTDAESMKKTMVRLRKKIETYQRTVRRCKVRLQKEVAKRVNLDAMLHRDLEDNPKLVDLIKFQIRAGSRTHKVYAPDERKLCLEIHSRIGNKAFRALKDFGFPLPNLCTIKTWKKNGQTLDNNDNESVTISSDDTTQR